MVPATDYVESEFLLAIIREDHLEARRLMTEMSDGALRELRTALHIGRNMVDDEQYERKRRERVRKP